VWFIEQVHFWSSKWLSQQWHDPYKMADVISEKKHTLVAWQGMKQSQVTLYYCGIVMCSTLFNKQSGCDGADVTKQQSDQPVSIYTNFCKGTHKIVADIETGQLSTH